MIDETPESNPPEKKVHRRTPPATPAVQAWLDGDEPRSSLMDTAENETAELWTRINSEAEQLRRRSTPIHLRHRILSSLPDLPQAAAPGEPSRISPVVLAVGGVLLLAIGAIIGTMLVR